jgi:GNAT superfamily N-acetyltransferase
MNYLPVQYDTSTLSRYAELFSKCFPASAGFTLDYLDWLYRLNPDGLAIGFDAWDGNKLVAHYVCVPVKALVSGRTVHALLSLNTATHPDYQGRGLFTKLAQFTFAAGAGAGLDCVFGVANANSTGGFVRKLGFRLVEPLEAKIGYGGLEIDWDIVDQTALFARQWSPDSLKWRCANPSAQFSLDKTSKKFCSVPQSKVFSYQHMLNFLCETLPLSMLGLRIFRLSFIFLSDSFQRAHVNFVDTSVSHIDFAPLR